MSLARDNTQCARVKHTTFGHKVADSNGVVLLLCCTTAARDADGPDASGSRSHCHAQYWCGLFDISCNTGGSRGGTTAPTWRHLPLTAGCRPDLRRCSFGWWELSRLRCLVRQWHLNIMVIHVAFHVIYVHETAFDLLEPLDLMLQHNCGSETGQASSRVSEREGAISGAPPISGVPPDLARLCASQRVGE